MAVMEERKCLKLFIDVPQIYRCCCWFFFFTEIGELPAQLDLMKKTIIRLVFDLNQIKIRKKGNFTAIKNGPCSLTHLIPLPLPWYIILYSCTV